MFSSNPRTDHNRTADAKLLGFRAPRYRIKKRRVSAARNGHSTADSRPAPPPTRCPSSNAQTNNKSYQCRRPLIAAAHFTSYRNQRSETRRNANKNRRNHNDRSCTPPRQRPGPQFRTGIAAPAANDAINGHKKRSDQVIQISRQCVEPKISSALSETSTRPSDQMFGVNPLRVISTSCRCLRVRVTFWNVSIFRLSSRA